MTDPIELPIEDTIDLHSFQPGETASLITEYLFQASGKLYSEVRIIHGKGMGVQREIVHSILRQHPDVVCFWDAADRGSTIVRLKQSQTHRKPSGNSNGPVGE
jgi:DNA-nicking Smr family endonuclease